MKFLCYLRLSAIASGQYNLTWAGQVVLDNNILLMCGIHAKSDRLIDILKTYPALVSSTSVSTFTYDLVDNSFEPYVTSLLSQIKSDPEPILSVPSPIQQIEGRSFLLVGKAGAGKSTFINKLFGREMCRTGSIELAGGVTKSIEIYEATVLGTSIRIYDTPGFGDQSIDPVSWIWEFFRKVISIPIDQLVFVHRGDYQKVDIIDTLIYQFMYQFISARTLDIRKNVRLLFTHCDKVDSQEELEITMQRFRSAFETDFKGIRPACFCTKRSDTMQDFRNFLETAQIEKKFHVEFQIPSIANLRRLIDEAIGNTR